MELPRRQDRLPKHAWAKRALMLFASKPQNWACQALRLRGGDLRARLAARSTRVLVRLLVLGVHPPPAGAGPPYYPYAKVISSARKDLQGSLCLACTPPQPGQVPAITRMQKLSAVQEATYKKSFCAACAPPQPGQVPAITRMQKLSTVHKPTPTWKRCTV